MVDIKKIKIPITGHDEQVFFLKKKNTLIKMLDKKNSKRKTKKFKLKVFFEIHCAHEEKKKINWQNFDCKTLRQILQILDGT